MQGRWNMHPPEAYTWENQAEMKAAASKSAYLKEQTRKQEFLKIFEEWHFLFMHCITRVSNRPLNYKHCSQTDWRWYAPEHLIKCVKSGFTGSSTALLPGFSALGICICLKCSYILLPQTPKLTWVTHTAPCYERNILAGWHRMASARLSKQFAFFHCSAQARHPSWFKLGF